MKKFLRNLTVQENLLYAVLWLVVFVAPVAVLVARSGDTHASDTFAWSEVWHVWKLTVPFFVLFLVHNFAVAPLWMRGRRVAYGIGVAAAVALFALCQCVGEAGRPLPPVARGEFPAQDLSAPPPHIVGPIHDDIWPSDDADLPAPPQPPADDHRRPKPLDREMSAVIAFIVAILLVGMNLGIKMMFRSTRREKEMAALERQTLEQQLEYLKYQINPHFLMNTLNNIHALVEIDPDKAQATILELSRMMRYALYEGSRPTVPLSRDVDFIRHYIALMQIRYADSVRITLDLPETMPDVAVPPMLFVTFVENAFKHGVTYRQQSYIDVSLRLYGDELHFACANSKPAPADAVASPTPSREPRGGGVGIENTRRRLDILYGDRYTLDIRDTADRYEVNLLFRV